MSELLTDAELNALVVMVESYVADGWPRVAELIPNAIAELREHRLRVEVDRLKADGAIITESQLQAYSAALRGDA